MDTGEVYVDFLVPDSRNTSAPTGASAAVKPEKVVRRKFATPPVKVACLEW